MNVASKTSSVVVVLVLALIFGLMMFQLDTRAFHDVKMPGSGAVKQMKLRGNGSTKESSRFGRTVDSILQERLKAALNGPPRPDCGLMHYYHVPKNGGTSVTDMMYTLSQLNDKIEYGRIMPYSSTPRDENNAMWKDMFDKVDQSIMSGRLAKERKWLAVHQHHNSPGLPYMMPHFRRWKKKLEADGCQMILAMNLREPRSRAKSQIAYNHVTKQRFYEGGWSTENYGGQAFYLLYNKCTKGNETHAPDCQIDSYDRDSHTVSDAELEELRGYLTEFTIIGRLDQFDSFFETIEELAGWKTLKHPPALESGHVPTDRKSKPDYEITDKMLDDLQPALEYDYKLWDLVFGDADDFIVKRNKGA